MKNLSTSSKRLDVKPFLTYYMDQLSLNQLFNKYIPQGPKMHLAPCDVLRMLVFNIINSPSPLYKVSEWVTDYLDGIGEEPDEAKKYNDDCLGRNLDSLYECDRNALMTDLTANAIRAHQLELSRIHNDSTTITFKGRYENQAPEAVQLQHGHNKDFRPDCLQLVYGINITEDGNVPLSFQLFDGNTPDDTTHIPNWNHMRQLLESDDFIYIADCKLCSEESLDHIHLHQGSFITVVPKRRKILKPFQEQLKNNEVQWEYAYSVTDNRKPSEQNNYYTFEAEPTVKGYRMIWIYNTAKAAQDKKTRERRLSKAEEKLTEIAGKLNRYKFKTKKQIEAGIANALRNVKGIIDVELIEIKKHFRKKIGAGRPGPNSVYKECTHTTYQIKWQLNLNAIEDKALNDGTFPLITNTQLKCSEVLKAYKNQAGLEKRFNTTKSVLDIAPVFLEKSSRIEAIVFLYFVALMVISLIERAIRKKMAQESIEKLPILPGKMKTARPTWNNLRYLFRNAHVAQIFIKDRLVQQTLKGLHDIHFKVLRLIGVPAIVYQKFSRQAEL
jgi:transposase